MLERPSFSLAPWRCDGGERLRELADSTGESLGIVRWSCPRRRSVWRLLPPRPILEVLETADRALVMSVRQAPLSRDVWIVRDGEDNEVGRLRGNDLLDPWSEPFAQRIPHVGGWLIREIGGRDYATLSETDVVAFTPGAIDNPFLRMLVFGSFLLVRPRPDTV